MQIVVCVKQVLDTAAKISIKDGAIDGAGSPRVMNPYDEFAVEEAIRIRERKPDSEITLISLGPEGFKDTLRAGLAMGADKAIHCLDPTFEGLDNLGVAQVLAQAIRTLKFDLVLCGRQAVDDDMAQVGPALGILLNIPFISVITRLEFSDSFQEAVVTRQIEGGSEVLETALPFVGTCQKGLNEPRLPALKGIIAAKKKPIEVLDRAALGLTEGPDASDNRIRQTGLALPDARKKGRVLEGPHSETIPQLVRILREEEKLI